MSHSEDEFLTLLEEALSDPVGADYEHLRRVYVDCPLYQPWARDQEAVEELHMRVATGRFEEAVALGQEILRSDPLAVTLRLSLAKAFDGAGRRRDGTDARTFANGLMRCVLRTGNGRSLDSAIVVHDARELHLVLDVLGLTATRSELKQIDGRWFDVIETSGDRVMHFDVTLPRLWLNRIMGLR